MAGPHRNAAPQVTIDEGLPLIIAAEDNDDDAVVLERLIRSAGIRNPLRRFSDGEQLVHFLQRFGSRPCVVFLDLRMPHMNGFDVLAWIRSQRQLFDVKVFMLSGAKTPNDAALARQLGADDYLTKFPEPDALASRIRPFCSKSA